MITEENVAKYKIDVMNKVDDILINLDKHKYDKQYTTTNKEIYFAPILSEFLGIL